MKIAIAGYGVEGEASYRYWNTPDNDVTIVDTNRAVIHQLPYGAKTILGEDAFEKLSDFDMVVRTPSLSPQKLASAHNVWSATNEFFTQCPAPIIGVTGSKGKGTTSSLIASILRAGGHTVHLVGNIGIPALSILGDIQPTDIVVYELSSFQLWDAKKSPTVAVVLYIEPEHLDIHTNEAEYISAKANIARFQAGTDQIIYNTDNEKSRFIAQQSKARQIPYPSNEAGHVINDMFYFGEQELCSVLNLKIPGQHNQDNACAAISAAWQWVTDREAIASGLAAFDGLPHRLKFVREVNGVAYYDDSIATTPGSAIAALKAFGQPKILILGGSSKGADFTELAEIMRDNHVKQAILIGDEAMNLERELQKVGVPVTNFGTEHTMQEVVARAVDEASLGDVVILSPACASFGMFKNYNDRGDQFIAAINDLS